MAKLANIYEIRTISRKKNRWTQTFPIFGGNKLFASSGWKPVPSASFSHELHPIGLPAKTRTYDILHGRVGEALLPKQMTMTAEDAFKQRLPT